MGILQARDFIKKIQIFAENLFRDPVFLSEIFIFFFEDALRADSGIMDAKTITD